MTIWKFQFEISGDLTISMPANARVLSIQIQNGVPCMWAIVNQSYPCEERNFKVFGTGHPMSAETALLAEHVGTFQDGQFVWHVFE